MDTFFKKTGSVIMLFLGVTIFAAIWFQINNVLGVLVLVFGLPYGLYRIMTKPTSMKAPPVSRVKNENNLSIEITLDFDESPSRPRTIDVGRSNYEIPKRSGAKLKFFGKNEPQSVHGYDIGGLLYIGSTNGRSGPSYSVAQLSGYSSYQEDEQPDVIDPKLPIKKNSLADSTGYWPNYSVLSPAQRNRYLQWLAEGRGDTDDLGYVFLYFYGFERYVLQGASKDGKEVRNVNLLDIVSETARLLKLFGHSNSFSQYANQLLDAICLIHWPEHIDSRKSSFPNRSPLAATYAISKLASSNSGESLDADWALHWLLGYGTVSRTKVVREHYELLRVLFKKEYQKATKGGLIVPFCKTKLRLSVRPASRGIGDSVLLSLPNDWCDPTGLQRPMKSLIKVSDATMPALRSMAKAIAKKDIAGVMAAWPAGTPTDTVPLLHKFKTRILSLLNRSNVCTLAVLADAFAINVTDKSTKAQLKQLAAGLASCGYTMVPDPLLTPVPLKASDQVITYKGDRPVELSPEGQKVALSVQLGSLLAMADGVLHANEKVALSKVINAHPNSTEREYLATYLEWRLAQPPSTNGLKQQISSLTNEQRHELAQLLISLALADGVLDPEELKQLEKLFAQLGFAAGMVSELLHTSAGSARSKPVVSVPARDNGGTPWQLDHEALQAHKESTKEIQNVLHKIFQEEPEEADIDVEEMASVSNDSWHKGELDDTHDTLATWLLTQDEWPMEDIVTKCKSLGLLADGALEVINNAAFETLGDSLLEIGDPVEIYRDVIPA